MLETRPEWVQWTGDLRTCYVERWDFIEEGQTLAKIFENTAIVPRWVWYQARDRTVTFDSKEQAMAAVEHFFGA